MLKEKRETSWRPWGGILTEEDAKREQERINKELADLKNKAEFPMKILPLSAVKDPKELDKIQDIESSDVVLVYAAGGFTTPDYELLFNNVFQEWLYKFLPRGKT